MAYDVRFSIPERTLGKADVKFAIWRNGTSSARSQSPRDRLFGSPRITRGATR
jgi:hypothetical protein